MSDSLSRIKHYLAMQDAQPMPQNGDVIHRIHTATEFEGELLLSDLRNLVVEIDQIHGEQDRVVSEIIDEILHEAQTGITTAPALVENTMQGRTGMIYVAMIRDSGDGAVLKDNENGTYNLTTHWQHDDLIASNLTLGHMAAIKSVIDRAFPEVVDIDGVAK